MGGNAFKEYGLPTPRMPPAVYHFALGQIEEKLCTIFQKVAHCIEGPGKKDYGVLDVLVLPGSTKPSPSLDSISQLLNAKRSYHEPSNGIFVLAIPWHYKAFTSSTAIKDVKAAEKTPDSVAPNHDHDSPLYIQLDLRICTSDQELTWRLFAHGHGDLINIVSAMVRHKGLTITDQALYLRIKDIETHNKKLARVELSRNPDTVLHYLGLDSARFWHPFWSLNEMMSYIATCRFHNPARVNGIDATAADREAATRTTLHTYDNQRLVCRPIFQHWFQTYLPAYVNDLPGISAHLSREEVIDDALTFFGPETRARYEKQRKETMATTRRGQIWSEIRTEILKSNPEMGEKDIHDALRGLKREIILAPQESQTDVTPVQAAYSRNDSACVISWAVSNHTAALSRYRQRLKGNQTDLVVDFRKTNPYSKSELETYSIEDDKVIRAMKGGGSTWLEILDVLGKKSKSQLQSHWKILQAKEQEESVKDNIAPEASTRHEA